MRAKAGPLLLVAVVLVLVLVLVLALAVAAVFVDFSTSGQLRARLRDFGGFAPPGWC